MSKRPFISFGLLAIVVVLVAFWAFSKDGSGDSSPEKVASSDELARELFAGNCGRCHTLARAGTYGVVGPDLDERLAGTGPATSSEMVESTQQRVESAIENGFGNGAMPAGILQAENAETVANFVARVAGQ